MALVIACSIGEFTVIEYIMIKDWLVPNINSAGGGGGGGEDTDK